MGKTEKVILAVILFIGAFLRIYNYWDFSLSNDELSALARLNFGSFSDLIQNGVRIDGHPAAAQVILYYFTKWFDTSVAVVRLPFVLAGVGAIYFMYRLGKEWISSSAGLLSAAAFATLVFPLLYSRIARPYSLGMLFALMAAVYWIRIVKTKNNNRDFIWLAVSLALCAYTHYFCGLVAAILALSGMFLIKGQSLKLYLFALLGAFVLYVPYISIFLHQLGLGGIGQWLGPPPNDWVFQHAFYVFNESWFTLICVGFAAALGCLIKRPKLSFLNTFLPLALFGLPILIGTLYSIYVNPVMQHSTLLFSFPFLVIFTFSGWSDASPKTTTAVSLSLMVVLLASTLFEKHFFRTNHFGVFKEVAQHISDWSNELEQKPLLVGDFNHPFYIHYYLDKIGPVEMNLYRVTDDEGLINLKRVMSNTQTDHLVYGWSTVNQSPEINWLIREKYPQIVEHQKYFNSAAILYSKAGKVDYNSVDSFQFERTDNWIFNPEAIIKDSLNTAHMKVNQESPYGPTFIINIVELEDANVNTITVKLTATIHDKESPLQIVYEQANDDGSYSWESDPVNKQLTPEREDWGVFHYAVKASRVNEDVLKIYPWLPEGSEVEITGMEVRLHYTVMPITSTSSNCTNSPIQSSNFWLTLLSCLRALNLCMSNRVDRN